MTAPPADPLAEIGQVTLVGPDSVIAGTTAQYTLDIRDRNGRALAARATGVEWQLAKPNNPAELDKALHAEPHEVGPGRVELAASSSGAWVIVSGRVHGWSAGRNVRLAAPPDPVNHVSFCCVVDAEPTYTVRVGDTTAVYFTAFDSPGARLETGARTRPELQS